MSTGVFTPLTTEDEEEIQGLLYRDSNHQKSTVVVIIHGATMNFSVGISRFLPDYLVAQGYGAFSLNLRSSNLGFTATTFDHKLGFAWQSYRKNMIDISAAIKFLKSVGYKNIILLGHSWGGLLAAQYVATDDCIKALVLLSPLISYKMLLTVNYKDTFEKVVLEAKELVQAGKNDVLILAPQDSNIPAFSASTIVEMTSEATPSLDEQVVQIKIPILFVGASEDHSKLLPKYDQWISINKVNRSKLIINDCDHFYQLHEEDLAESISEWLNIRFSKG